MGNKVKGELYEPESTGRLQRSLPVFNVHIARSQLNNTTLSTTDLPSQTVQQYLTKIFTKDFHEGSAANLLYCLCWQLLRGEVCACFPIPAAACSACDWLEQPRPGTSLLTASHRTLQQQRVIAHHQGQLSIAGLYSRLCRYCSRFDQDIEPYRLPQRPICGTTKTTIRMVPWSAVTRTIQTLETPARPVHVCPWMEFIEKESVLMCLLQGSIAHPHHPRAAHHRSTSLQNSFLGSPL